MQPKEGRKELAPREIKFRYRRLDTTIRERAGSSQEGRKRAKDTPGYFLCFFFLFIPNSRCSRQKSSRHGRDESRQESSMGTVKGSPTISTRLFVGYGPSERLRLLVGHALIHKCTHDIEITTNIHLQTCASWRHVNQPETLPTY